MAKIAFILSLGMGFGLSEGSKWNKAILGKYLWALTLKQDSLWLRWFHSIYLIGCNFWDVRPAGNCSWYWRKLLKLRDSITQTMVHSCVIKDKFLPSKCYVALSGVTTVFNPYKQIWFYVALPKHRFVFWLALTRDLLFSRLPDIDLSCSVCESSNEDHAHLFFQCPYSWALFCGVNGWLGGIFRVSQWYDWLLGLNPSKLADACLIAVFQALVYMIWYNRNACLFSRICYSQDYCFSQIKWVIKCRLSLFSKKS